MLPSLLLGLALVASPLAASFHVHRETLSYRNLTAREPSLAFYRSAGRSYKNQRVHVHAAAARLLGKPSRIVTSGTGAKLYVFENQSVPIVVSPHDVYFRKILERTKVGDRICVRGIVRTEPKGGKDRLALYAHTIKRAHDKPAKKSAKSR